MKRKVWMAMVSLGMTLFLCVLPLGVSADAGEDVREKALLAWYQTNVAPEASTETFSYTQVASAGEVEFYRVHLAEDMFASVHTYERLGEVVLQFPNPAPYVVYANGEVFAVSAAYAAEVLTPEILSKENFAGSSIRLFSFGDVDLDGQISISDVVLFRNSIMAGDGDTVYMDMDDDGAITISDVVNLRGRIVAG